MAQQSVLLLSTSTSAGYSSATSAGAVAPLQPFVPTFLTPVSYFGTPVRADGWYGRVDHIYTLACYVSNLQGTVHFEASLADDPTDGDWFDVLPPITFPRLPIQTIVNGVPVINTTAGPGETAVLAMSFRANVTWIRASVVQTGSGYVDRILLNQ